MNQNTKKKVRELNTNQQRNHRQFYFLCLLIISLLTFTVIPAFAATYYVDAATGDDTNPGTSANPWETLDRTYTWYSGGETPVVQEGDTILFRNGNYGDFTEVANNSSQLVYRTSLVTYKADTGHSPALTNIEIDNQDKWGGTGDGDSYLQIEGFDVTGGVVITNTSYVNIVNCVLTREPLPYAGVYAPYFSNSGSSGMIIRDSYHITVEGCDIHNAYRGINLEGSGANITIESNEIYDLAEDGIEASGYDNQIIEDNYIHNIHKFQGAIAFTCTVTGTFTNGETVIQAVTGAEGIYNGDQAGSADAYIFQTTATEFETAGAGGGTITGQNSGATLSTITNVDPSHTDAIQFNSTTISNVIIRRNRIIREGPGGFQALKIQPKGNIYDNFVLENNLIWAPKPILGGTGTTNIKINNNTFFSHKAGESWTGFQDVSFFNVTEMFNNIFGCGGSVAFNAVIEGNNIVDTDVSPESAWNNVFTDWSNGDFSLPRTSTAVGFGNAAYAPATDILGASRDANPDAGAYEFIGITANAGIDQFTKNTNVTLDGSDSESSDPNGNPITRYLWTCDPAINGGDPNLYDGANSSAAVTLPNDATAHTITLTVFDGDGNSDSDTVDITVYDNKLTTSSDTDGSVTEPQGGEGDYYYGTGDIVDIVAEPVSSLYEFVDWTGTGVGDVNDTTSATATIAMNADYTITANFQLKPTLTITSDSGGSVTTPGEGVFPYATGTTNIPITAAPDANYHFDGWTGTATVANAALATTTITSISANVTLHANFTRERTVTISSTVNGSVTTPGEGAITRDEGTVQAIAVTKTATGYFMFWTGTAVDASAVADPAAAGTTVTFSGDYTLIANFGLDATGPTVTAVSPTADYLYAPTNALVVLTVADAGTGVDPATVEIVVSTPNDPNVIVYTGDTPEYTSATGKCRRAGTSAAYTYYYQPDTPFNAEDLVTVTVDADDLQTPTSNDTTGATYSFEVATPIFGVNKVVNSVGTTAASNVDTVTYPGDGTIIAVWQQSDNSGNNDIYYGELVSGADAFATSINLTNDATLDQINPVVDANATEIFIVWQHDAPAALNDIVVYTSANNWATPIVITDPGNTTDQTNPAMAIDSAGKIYVTWLQEGTIIQVSTSTNSGATWAAAVNVVTGLSSAQTQPAIAIDDNDTAYIVWADPNGFIIGATSADWSDPNTIDNSGNLANPVIATESTGTVLHILWDDGAEVYHCETTDGLTAPYTTTDITGASGAQTNPTIAVSVTNVYAAWKDAESGNTDIFYAEKTGSSFGSNISINDDAGTDAQLEPFINIDTNGKPYIAWSDNRTSSQSIYFAAATFIGSSLKSSTVDSSAGGNTIVEIDSTTAGVIDDVNDIVVTIPPGELPADTTITIAQLYNPPAPPTNSFGLFYEFGPSGLTFTDEDGKRATITIPHDPADEDSDFDTWTIYWYDLFDEEWKTTGITNITHNVISASLHTITFETTHFTGFGVGGGVAPPPGSGGGGGGGCSVSPYGGGSIPEFLLPYAVIGIVLAGLKLKNRRKKSV